jgi:NitT/TauT family transport system permease protein
MNMLNILKSPKCRSTFDLLLLGVAFVALWQIFYEIAGSVALASPLAATRNALQMLATSDFWMNAAATLKAFGIAVVIEAIAGLAIGIFLGLQRFTGDVFEPMLTGLYSVPKLMFFPMITLFFGIGLASEVAFGVLQGIISIILFTMSAVRNIKPVYMKTGKTMNLSTTQMMLTIALPGALPEIFTGLRIGVSSALIGVILCEMFGSSRGLGFILMNAMQNNIVLDISSQTLLLIVFAAGLSGVLMAADYKLHRRV